MLIEPKSCIYEGYVRHRRYEPVENAFRYRLFMMYLDLEELPEVLEGPWWSSGRRPALAWFRRADYHGARDVPLGEAVRQTVENVTGVRPTGPIRVLTHLRYWGYCFNPVSFYYIFDAAGTRVETMMAEITNTPWGERRAIVLDERHDEGGRGVRRFRFKKDFHVSPFMPMDIEYDWRFTEPGERCIVNIEDWRAGRKIFDATLSLERRKLTRATLRSCLIRYPFMTLKVIGAIHYQALRLWLKGAVFHAHPKYSETGRAQHRPGNEAVRFLEKSDEQT